VVGGERTGVVRRAVGASREALRQNRRVMYEWWSFDLELVERYLRSHGSDPRLGEDSFIVNAPAGLLHVHLVQTAANPHLVDIQVTGPPSFSRTDRRRLARLARRRNRRGEIVEAVLCESMEPARVGVVAEAVVPLASGIGYQEFADVVDTSIARAGEFFAELISISARQRDVG
jgi:hypothetical protein